MRQITDTTRDDMYNDIGQFLDDQEWSLRGSLTRAIMSLFRNHTVVEKGKTFEAKCSLCPSSSPTKRYYLRNVSNLKKHLESVSFISFNLFSV